MNEWRAAYSDHKASANKRGIPFELTYGQWLEIWGEKIALRGRGSDQLGMCRTRDEGGYSAGNVRLDSPKGNAQERAVVSKVRKAAAAWKPKLATSPLVEETWITGRNHVFDEYTEDEEEYTD